MSVPVVVLGAGVVGLTNALELKKNFPHLDITVAGSFLPGDFLSAYTSPFAGANWHSFASNHDSRLQKFDSVGYHRLMRLADNPALGIWKKPNMLFYTPEAMAKPHSDPSRLTMWFDKMTNTRVLHNHELRPGTVYGTEFDGLVISVPTYLAFLAQQCLAMGICIRRIPDIRHIDETRNLHPTSANARIVINCCGLGAASIAGLGDKNRNFLVRGQVLLVRNCIDRVLMVEGFEDKNEMLYIFPRKEGGCIIGGSFHANNGNTTEDPALTQRISQRALQFAPELVDPAANNPPYLDIVRVNVGLRPFRDGGIRIEIDPAKKWLIHCYGAGGGGYQGSYGFSQQVVELAGKLLNPAKL